MGCFLACFGGGPKRKRGKKRLSGVATPPTLQARLPLQILETNQQLHLSLVPLQKPLSVPDIPATHKPLELREKTELEIASIGGTVKKKVTFDPNVKTIAEVPPDDDWEKKDVEEGPKVENQQDAGIVRRGVFPPNHRYSQNCDADGDDDIEDAEDGDYEDCDTDGDEYGDLLMEGGSKEEEEEEESYESFFSLPLQKEGEGTKEVNSREPQNASPLREMHVISNSQSARDRSQYVHPVLNPIENLSQWREAKMLVASSSPKHFNKENRNLEQDTADGFNLETAFEARKPISDSKKSTKVSSKQGVSVDASLSSWLGTPPASDSYRSSSLMSREEQPILGALTTEDLKHSVTSSPRQSPRKNPDEIPIVGSFGSYWNCENQDSNTASSPYRKYREDMKVNFDSIPFETSLERAMKKDAAEKLQLPLERTPGEIPIAGSLEGYWNYHSKGNDSSSGLSSHEVKGIPNTTRKYSEDKRVAWHSTPFEVRLEKALKKNAGEVCPS